MAGQRREIARDKYGAESVSSVDSLFVPLPN